MFFAVCYAPVFHTNPRHWSKVITLLLRYSASPVSVLPYAVVRSASFALGSAGEVRRQKESSTVGGSRTPRRSSTVYIHRHERTVGQVGVGATGASEQQVVRPVRVGTTSESINSNPVEDLHKLSGDE